jgi:short-subunit dehydrogenase
MHARLKPISEQVIVITGASSGIGLATAKEGAQRGARLVLAARSDEDLDSIGGELSSQGAQVETVTADVSSEEDVRRIAQAAISRFGGFDTWVNNAGVGIWGRLSEVSDEDNRRLFETNFWGTVYGSLVAAEHLRTRGGAIVNLGSVESDMTLPLQGVYSASKHAVKAFSEVLRVELAEEEAPVSVTVIKPAGIATPMPQHMKNYMDTEMTWAPPVYQPEDVARAILHAATHPVRDLHVGSASKAFSFAEKHTPRLLDKLNEKFMFHAQTLDEPKRRDGDNLHHAGRDGRERGYFPTRRVRPSGYTRLAMHPGLSAALILAGGLGALAVLGSRPTRWEREGYGTTAEGSSAENYMNAAG